MAAGIIKARLDSAIEKFKEGKSFQKELID